MIQSPKKSRLIPNPGLGSTVGQGGKGKFKPSGNEGKREVENE